MFCVVSADALSGNELFEECIANKPLVVGYVAGISDKAAIDSDILFKFFFDTYDVMKTAEQIQRNNDTLVKSSLALDGYCIPEGTTPFQKANAYCRYLADNPERRSSSGAELWVSAAKAVSPCQ
jgi:hypothetical protein